MVFEPEKKACSVIHWFTLYVSLKSMRAWRWLEMIRGAVLLYGRRGSKHVASGGGLADEGTYTRSVTTLERRRKTKTTKKHVQALALYDYLQRCR